MPVVTEYSKGWLFGFGSYVIGTDADTGKEIEILADLSAGGYLHFVTKEGEYQDIIPKRREENSPIPLPLFPDEKGKEIDISYCTNPKHTPYSGQNTEI